MQNMNRPSPSELKKDLTTLKVKPRELIAFVIGPVLKHKLLLVINIILLFGLAFLNFLVPQFTKTIIDIALPKHSVSFLVEQVLWMLLATAAIGLFSFANAYLMQRLSLEAITDIRLETYKKLLHQDYSYYQDTKTGDLMVRLTSDIANIQSLISNNTLSLFSSFFTFFGVLGFIAYRNLNMALLITLTFPLLYLDIQFFRGRVREANSKMRSNLGKISNQLQSTFTQIELIKDYITEDYEEKKFGETVEQGNSYQLETTKWQNILSALTSFINTIGTAIVLLYGGYLIIHHAFSVGDLVAYLSYLALLQMPITQVSQVISNFQNALVSYDHVEDVLRVKEKIVEVVQPKAFPTLEQGIALKDVSFSYGDRNDVLSGLTFNIPVGKSTALVGRSGAGKSTLIRLLTRMYDTTSGGIYYDAVEIKDLSLKELRQHISVVSQEVAIIDGTIRDNIRYGSFSSTDDDIWQAAKLADISEFIDACPQKMDTQVGERGVKLSGGQKQRLSIARAFLKNAPIVILDEATAALDNESEKQIQQAFDNLMKDRTSIVIAHRLSTIHNAYQIVVMDGGKVVEQGNHETLLAKDGLYKKLYDLQFE